MSWMKREMVVASRCDVPKCSERLEVPIALQTFGLDQQRSTWLDSHNWSDKLDKGVVVHLCPTHTKESKMATDKAIENPEPAPVTCSLCRKKRDVTGEDALDYSPAQVIFGGPLGWYSGDDGEVCADCMYLTMNGRINEIVRKDQ